MIINFNLTAHDFNLDNLQCFAEGLEALEDFLAMLNERIGLVAEFNEESKDASEWEAEWVKNLLPYADRMDLKDKPYSDDWTAYIHDEIVYEWEHIEKTIDRAFSFTGEENRKELEKLVKAIKG